MQALNIVSIPEIYTQDFERQKTWIDTYTNWAMKRSPLTPKHFHENIALTIAGGAIAGRCFVQMPFGRVFPNLYTLIVAKTSVFAKSTALGVANQVITQTMPDRLISSIPTPESFHAELSGAKPTNWDELPKEKQEMWDKKSRWEGRRLFVLDEAGMFFNALSRDYNSNMPDLIMRLYDPDGIKMESNTIKRGYTTIENQCLSCLFCTTPATIRLILGNPNAWLSGFWNRWCFVAETKLTEWDEGDYSAMPSGVIKTLDKISNKAFESHMEKPLGVGIDVKASKAFMETTRSLRIQIDKSEDEKIDALLSRIPVMHLKAALILAILESEGEHPYIKIHHWDTAARFAIGWHRDALLALELAQKSERLSKEEKCFVFIRSHRDVGGATARQIQQYTHLSAQDVDSILSVMFKSGMIHKNQQGKKVLWNES